jgi:pyruvate carboxylase
LGTFEFLVHESKPEYYFLEVNPRLQVEHTVTEEISGIDIVRSQLLLAKGATIESLNLPTRNGAENPPPVAAIQLRVTAEDAEKDFTISMGRVVAFQPPVGVGVRVDTHLSTTKPTIVGSSFDSLLTKIIVRAASLQAATFKGLRALNDTTIKGVKTNINVLMGILSHPDFVASRCDTRWLEANLEHIRSAGKKLEDGRTLSLREPYITSTTTSDPTASGAAGLGNAPLLFRKGDTFKLQLKDITTKQRSSLGKSATADEYLLRIDRVLTNNFPLQLMADTTFQSYGNSKTYGMNLTSTTQTSVASSRHRHADPTNHSHIGLPFPGQFVDMYVDEGDHVTEGELLCVVRQMKMELEVRAPRAGSIKWVCEAEEGEQVNEGLLLCELVGDVQSASVPHLSKL